MQAQNLIILNKNTNISKDINHQDVQEKFNDPTSNNEIKQDFIVAFAKASTIAKQSHPKASASLDVIATEISNNQLGADAIMEVSELKLVAADLPHLADNEATPKASEIILDGDNTKLKKDLNLSSISNPFDLKDTLTLNDQGESLLPLAKENEDMLQKVVEGDKTGDLFVQFYKSNKSNIDETKNNSASSVIGINPKVLSDLDVAKNAAKNQLDNQLSKTNHIISGEEVNGVENILKNNIELSAESEGKNEQILKFVPQKQLILKDIDENNDNLDSLDKKAVFLSKGHIVGNGEKKGIALDDNKAFLKNATTEVIKNENVKAEVIKNENVKAEVIKNENVKAEVVKNENVKAEVIKNIVTGVKDSRVDLKLLNIPEAQEVSVNRVLRRHKPDQKEAVPNIKNLGSELTDLNRPSSFKPFYNLNQNKDFNFDLLTKTSVNINMENNNDFNFFASLIDQKPSSSVASTTQSELFPKTFSNDVLSQIVSKTVNGIDSGRPTIKINLKPEHLGRLNLKISTDNNQVVIKILTESHMVKEIIENNMSQLKADLGSQGLEIDRFDVFVSSDSDSDARRYGNNKNFKMRDEYDDLLSDEEESDKEKKETPKHVHDGKGINLIGVFA